MNRPLTNAGGRSHELTRSVTPFTAPVGQHMRGRAVRAPEGSEGRNKKRLRPRAVRPRAEPRRLGWVAMKRNEKSSRGFERSALGSEKERGKRTAHDQRKGAVPFRQVVGRRRAAHQVRRTRCGRVTGRWQPAVPGAQARSEAWAMSSSMDLNETGGKRFLLKWMARRRG